ncbi:biopolymer transporter ExbD [Candidatus Vallotia cooleyia]|uniref:biopolymer transporter ExbD n=1 Tax=Candidatus Vallotiella adelgis TaxID=1177211 RepID=UPI001D003F83|nr:biopolymer transporter ExbD [Candidatus Vallotia cooleyia]UDG82344.1 Biopolymer transport protein ExbD [Candidatus Vallotia cooleyia]
MASTLIRSSFRGGWARRAISDMNVVPYIDVLLVLLVILMVTAPLASPSIIRLPTVGSHSPQEQTLPIIISIKPDGTTSVKYKNDTSGTMREWPMTPADLKHFIADLAKTYPNRPVVIGADKLVKYEGVMDVMSALKENGVKRVGLLVQQK